MPDGRYNYERVPRPKKLKEVPGYLKKLLGGFFHRLFYIFALVWKTGPWILISMSVIALVIGLLPVTGTIISRDILNSLQVIIEERVTGTPVNFWGSAVMFFIILLFVQRLLNRVVQRIYNAIARIAGEKVVKQVRVQIMEKARELDVASFDIPGFYEKLENANREAGTRPIIIIRQTFAIISTAIELISYVIVLATAPGLWWAILLVIAVSIPSAIVSFIYRRKTFSYIRIRSKDRREMNYYSGLMVDKDLAKEVRMFDLSDKFIDSYKNVFDRYYKGLRKLIVQENFWLIFISVISSAVNLVFYGFVAMHVFSGRLKIGDYNMYTGAIGSITTAVNALITTSADIYEGTLFIDNLISFLDEKQTVVPTKQPPEKVARNTAHTIVFENVSFRYPGTERDVIKNVNLTIRPGETVVLVGLNGAGKTTLIKLLTRLYDPTEGRILLDGKDIREYEPKEVYAMFGIIFQDFGKYAFTVTENISFGEVHKDIDMGAIREAAVQSGAEEYIEKLPDGYNTPLMRLFEQNGIELSIGQWQKLAVARAFYSESDILILDEPTASLDPMAEQDIFNQFDKLRADKTTIFVSHRLSSATVATKIVVLEYGEIIECGDHKTLMAKKGRYYELFSTQAKRYLDSDGEGNE